MIIQLLGKILFPILMLVTMGLCFLGTGKVPNWNSMMVFALPITWGIGIIFILKAM